VNAAVHQHSIKPGGPWIALYHHAGFRDHDLDVEIAVPVDATTRDIDLGDGRQMTVRTIPAVDMAVTALWRGSYQELSGAYMALNTYIHEQGHNYLGPAREVYLRGPGNTNDPTDYLTEVQYPVGEFEAETVIDGTDLPTGWKDTRPIRAQHLPLSRRARTTLDLAKIEAAALQQAEINPAHVLLGLLRESEGFAGHVLADFGMTLEPMRTLLPRGQDQSAEPRITASAQQVVSLADGEARQIGHHYIGTEHLLLGLAQQGDAGVIHLLTAGGVNTEQVRAAVLQMLNL
jgi:effector-binding domain-containing protein